MEVAVRNLVAIATDQVDYRLIAITVMEPVPGKQNVTDVMDRAHGPCRARYVGVAVDMQTRVVLV